MNKYNQLDYMHCSRECWLYYSDIENYIKLIMPEFLKWQELLKKGYSQDQLVDYFIEVVGVKLPELKGTKLYFSINIDDNNNYKII